MTASEPIADQQMEEFESNFDNKNNCEMHLKYESSNRDTFLQRVDSNIHQRERKEECDADGDNPSREEDHHNNLNDETEPRIDAIQGPDFEQLIVQWSETNRNSRCIDSYLSDVFRFGGQASELGKAIDILKEIIQHRNSALPQDFIQGTGMPITSPCTLFLGYTSNMVSTGMREIIKFLVKYKLVDCIVTSGGGIEEDVIKTFQHFYASSFNFSGKDLRSKNIAAIGNILVSNNGYCDLEDIMLPYLDEILIMQCERKANIPISEFIWKLGEIIDSEESILYWANKNKVPIFCPGIIDGAIGDIIFTHSLRKKSYLFERCPSIKELADVDRDYVTLDSSYDLIQLTKLALNSHKKAMLVLGGALPKHHIYNANLLANGADYAININTAQYFDSSDSGGSVEEAKSWGKINSEAKAVKICADATLVFPTLIRETFCKDSQVIQKVIENHKKHLKN